MEQKSKKAILKKESDVVEAKKDSFIVTFSRVKLVGNERQRIDYDVEMINKPSLPDKKGNVQMMKDIYKRKAEDEYNARVVKVK